MLVLTGQFRWSPSGSLLLLPVRRVSACRLTNIRILTGQNPWPWIISVSLYVNFPLSKSCYRHCTTAHKCHSCIALVTAVVHKHMAIHALVLTGQFTYQRRDGCCFCRSTRFPPAPNYQDTNICWSESVVVNSFRIIYLYLFPTVINPVSVIIQLSRKDTRV